MKVNLFQHLAIHSENKQRDSEKIKKLYGDGIATASRLLAMKRPDYFICLNSQNRNGLRKDFSLSSNIRYEEYWNNLITIIIYSVWWSSSCPRDNSEKQIWQFRVAMLDIIYYQQ